MQSENTPNLVVPKYSESKVSQIEKLVKSEWRDAIKRVDESSRFEKVLLTDEEKAVLNDWRNVAIEVANDLGCGDLVNFFEIDNIPFYRIAADIEDVPGDIIEAGVVDTGGGVFVAMGRAVEISDERMRMVFQHELGHMLMQSVVLIDDNDKLSVINKGFEKISRVEENQTELGSEKITYTKAAFCEPLAELFSYCCSNKMEKEIHVFSDLYVREVSFVAGMIDRMSYVNKSNFISEFKNVFSSFNHRDYSWYKHLINTIEKNISDDSDKSEEDVKKQALSFVRNFNNTEMEQGVDIIRQENGRLIHGRKLSELAREGEFYSNYEKFCNHLVGHSEGIKFKGMDTWMR